MNAADSHLTASARGALAGLSLCVLLSSLGTSIANVALPTLAHEFGASFQDVQWIVLAYLLSITTAIVTVGRLGDLVGRRRLLLLGIASFTCASVLCGAAPAFWLLLAARTVQGLGAATMMSLGVAIVGASVPKAKTGSAMGMLGTMSAIGTALGPSIGGVSIAVAGWRAVFFVEVPLAIVGFVLAHRYLPADPPRPPTEDAGIDPVGTLLLALTLAAYALAMTTGGGRSGATSVLLLAASGVGLVLFALVEGKVKAPLIGARVFRGSTRGANLAMTVLVSTVMMATLVVGPFYLSRSLGLEAAIVGIVMSAGPLVAATTGVPAGRVVDRLGAQRTTAVGLLGVAVGSLLLWGAPVSFGLLGYVVPTVVSTASYALFQAANNTAVMTDVRPEQRGLVAGLLNLSRNLGLITGASAMGAVFSFAAGTADVAHASAQAAAAGMRGTFAVGAGLAIVALGVGVGSRALTLRPSAPSSLGRVS